MSSNLRELAEKYADVLTRISEVESRGVALNQPQGIAARFASLFTPYQEQFYVIHFDAKLREMRIELVYQGTGNNIQISPRDVFRNAIVYGADSIALVHNHPSGDPTPSSDDVNATRRLKEAGALLGIDVVDHIVVGSAIHYVSMRQSHLCGWSD